MTADPPTELSITRDTTVAATWRPRERITRVVAAELAWLAAGIDVGTVPAEAVPGDLATSRRPVVHADATALADAIDLDAVAAGLRADATPVPALLAQLRPLLPAAAASHLHVGLTSQDVLDTATMWGLADDLATLADDVVTCGERCVALARANRDTPMRGRTLLQPARTTTFGLRAATWLDGLTGDRDRLRRARGLVALAWGGPVGTGAGQSEERVVTWGARLDLPVPPLPWHGNRDRVHELAGLLGTVAGQAASRARDVVLLAQPEVGEVVDTGAGGSSAMPDKANPAGAGPARAAARVAAAAAGGLLAGTEVELERAAGAWQAEWDLLPDLVVATGAALEHGMRALEQLEVRPDAMATHAGDDDPGRAGELVDRAIRAWQSG